ncbi:DUF2917 domain-containing protein [Azoarcus sp. KH32C]|uniref:DUF2917 domain-containing protein n=1 Tax=Azoarcus sp. KH32C TaxID=748247 RepID=UPI0002385F56|nr:DUF2917 domain-containing protein [Azoarcus sp. KH32C]BAL26710.1 hypothetical protein AZKH_4433 [Azoarcus sp. KH32C]
MDIRSEFTRVTLSSRESMVLDHTKGAEVTVRKGCIWLTQQGDSRDIVLKTGQSFTLSFDSGVLMTGVGNAEVVIQKPVAARQGHPSGWLERMASLLHVQPANAGRARRAA